MERPNKAEGKRKNERKIDRERERETLRGVVALRSSGAASSGETSAVKFAHVRGKTGDVSSLGPSTINQYDIENNF